MTDKHDKPYTLVDYEAKEGVNIQIGVLGHKLWVCIDGKTVLRVKAPKITVEDMRGED